MHHQGQAHHGLKAEELARLDELHSLSQIKQLNIDDDGGSS